MKLKRLLGAEHGWGAASGTLLLLGFGLALLFYSVAGLAEASRLKPEERGCAAWLADSSGPRWVKLVGCKLELSSPTVIDGGVFIQMGAGGVLVSTDQQFRALLDGGAEGPITGYASTGGPRLEQGKQPPRLQTLFGLVVGLIAVALTVRSMFVRYLVDRDSSL